MIVLVDIELADDDDARPRPGTELKVDLLDTSQVDDDAVLLASSTAIVLGAASSWLATTELAADEVDPRSDLTVWVRVAASGEPHTAPGDWITMQHVPVAPGLTFQRVVAPVRRVGS